MQLTAGTARFLKQTSVAAATDAERIKKEIIMGEVLIGVIIGGLIASIAPITTLIIDHKRWKKEAQLEYLKSERKRLSDN